MLRTWCAAMISCIAASLILTIPVGATPATPAIAVEQQGPLQMRLTSSTGTHWSWTVVDAGGWPVAGGAENPFTAAFALPGDYTALLDAFDDDPLAPEAAHAEAAFHVYAQPGASFTYAQLADGTIQFTDASSGEPTSWTWSFPGGKYEGRVPPPQTLPVGTSTVSLEVANPAASHTISLPVTVNGPPVAAFAILSSPAAIDAPVRLDASRSTDPNGDALSYTWDLDGDGRFGDATGPVQTVSYPTAGRYKVAVQISDGHGASVVAEGGITVLADEAPVISFANNPIAPSVGAVVAFTATASDPDGSVRRIEWDLDDDGQFDDAGGPAATWTYHVAGLHRVAVRAVDDRGVATVVFRTLDVASIVVLAPVREREAAAPAPAPQVPPPASPSAPVTAAAAPPALLAPFPVVRLRGQTFRGAVRITLLKVQAPPGAAIRVRCRGGSCGAKRADVRVTAARAATRVRSLEGRMLRANTVVEVFVTAPGRIGKYTRFRVRRDAAPVRTDLCLSPGHAKPTACPTT